MKMHRRRRSMIDSSTFEFPRAGWIATHALAVGGLAAMIWMSTRHRRM